MHNRFVVDSESTVREMAELAVTNWLGAQRFGANDHDRKVGNSRGAVSRRCERNAEVLDHRQRVRRRQRCEADSATHISRLCRHVRECQRCRLKLRTRVIRMPPAGRKPTGRVFGPPCLRSSDSLPAKSKIPPSFSFKRAKQCSGPPLMPQ